MPTGYDNRGNSRDTFAEQPNAPVRGGRGAVAGSAGSRVFGGQAGGGAISAGPQTNAAPIATGFGAYFEKIMAPAVERKQQQRFFEGFQRAQAGEALDELDKSATGINKIFGPSSFEEGANFYTAKTAINTWNAETLADMDNLKRLPPEEVAKVMADRSALMMTGHGTADQIIQSGIMEAAGPLLSTITKERAKWQQEVIVEAQSASWDSGATALQGLLSTNAELTDPSDEVTTAVANAVQGFASGIMKPDGQTDESYKASLLSLMKRSIKNGNFYAVEILKRQGIYSVLDDKDQAQLDTDLKKYGHLAQEDVMYDRVDELIALDTGVALGRISSDEVATKLQEINASISSKTGVDAEYFSASDIRTGAGKPVAILIAKARREERAAERIRERNEDRAYDAQIKAQEEQEEANAVRAAWGSGQATTFLAEGGKRSSLDVLAMNDVAQGNFGNIANSFGSSGFVSAPVATQLQARVTSSLGDKYTKDTKAAFGQWAALYAERPSAAEAYYGKYHKPMQNFQGLVAGGATENAAYVTAFGDPSIYAIESVPAGQKKQAAEAVAEHIDGRVAYFGGMFGIPDNLNEYQTRLLAGSLTNEVAINSKNNSGTSVATLTQNAADGIARNNKVEMLGPIGWKNKPGTPTIASLMGSQPQEANRILTAVLKQKLSKAGGDIDADDWRVTRINSGDETYLDVIAYTDGKPTHVSISVSHLKATRAELIKLERSGPSRPSEGSIKLTPGTGPKY